MHPGAHGLLDLRLVLERIPHVAPSRETIVEGLVLIASRADQFRAVELVLGVRNRTEFRNSFLGLMVARNLRMRVLEAQQVLV